MTLQFGEGHQTPQGFSQFSVGQFYSETERDCQEMLERVRVLTCGQSEVLQADLVFSPVLPAEQHGHLEGGHLQVKFSSPDIEYYVVRNVKAVLLLLISEGDGPVGHVMMPLQLPAAVFRFVKLFNLKFKQQSAGLALSGSWTKPRV